MIPISALEKYVYCPRQCALVLVDGIWRENIHTVSGSRFHRRVDSEKTSLERGVKILRSVQVWSDTLDLIGRADAVHVTDGKIMPVEYKAGARHGDAAEVQVCAQALCLEEMTGRPITRAAVWYQGHRRRHEIELRQEIRRRTHEVIEAVRSLRDSRSLPAAPNDERCSECQLRDHCMPGATDNAASVTGYLAEMVYRVKP
jgi:CRISPR-associated exonuclease Cas4